MKAILLTLAALFLASGALAADGDVQVCNRGDTRVGWGCVRYLVSDSDTTVSASTAMATAQLLAKDVPWDYYRFWVDASDVCTSWSLQVRDYPTTDTAQCEGTCDPHTLETLTSTGATSFIENVPLGEQFDVNITAITTCTVSVYVDFYYRSQAK